jgi:MATE family multidrug resistance protein
VLINDQANTKELEKSFKHLRLSYFCRKAKANATDNDLHLQYDNDKNCFVYAIQENIMLFKKLIVLSGPLMAAEISYISMSFVDAILMGLLSLETLSGGGLGVSVLHLLTITSIGIVASVGNIVAVAYGAKRVGEITSAIQGGLLVSFLLGISILIIISFLDRFLIQLNFIPSQIHHAMVYVDSASLSVFALLIFRVFRGFSVGLLYTASVFKISVLGAIINLPVSYALMNGVFGLPALGLAGIGYGTSLVSWVMVVLIIGDLFRVNLFNNYNFWVINERSFKGCVRLIKPILTLGFPIGIAYALEASLYTATTFLVGMLGDVSLAAHHVVLRCTSVTFRLPAAIAQASSVLVGKYYGEGDFDAVRRMTKIAVFLCLIVSACTSVFYVFLPEIIVGWFIRKDDLNYELFSKMAIPLLMFVGLFQFIASIQVVLMGVLRGLKQTTAPTIATAIGYWVIGFPCAYLLLKVMDFGVVGVWLGLGIGLCITLLLLIKLCLNMHSNLLKFD